MRGQLSESRATECVERRVARCALSAIAVAAYRKPLRGESDGRADMVVSLTPVAELDGAPDHQSGGGHFPFCVNQSQGIGTKR